MWPRNGPMTNTIRCASGQQQGYSQCDGDASRQHGAILRPTPGSGDFPVHKKKGPPKNRRALGEGRGPNSGKIPRLGLTLLTSSMSKRLRPFPGSLARNVCRAVMNVVDGRSSATIGLRCVGFQFEISADFN